MLLLKTDLMHKSGPTGPPRSRPDSCIELVVSSAIRTATALLFLVVVYLVQADAGASSTPKNLVNSDASSLNLSVASVATAAISNQFQNEYQYRGSAAKAATASAQSDRHKSSSSSQPLFIENFHTEPLNPEVWTDVPDCRGRTRLNRTRGVITDGFGNYLLNQQCGWLIDSGIENATISIRLIQLSTECNYDILSIYDGDSVYSKLVASYSGDIKDFRETPVSSLTDSLPTVELKTHSGKAFISWQSDTAQSMPGFYITYAVNACPLDCSYRGECDYETLKCSNCNGSSFGDGCQFTNKTCDSNSTQSGCSEKSQLQMWQKIDDDDDIGNSQWVGSIEPRAFHRSVVVEDIFYAFGGKTQELANTNLGIFRHVITSVVLAFDLKARRWIREAFMNGTTGLDHLAELSGHTATAHGNKVFIYGGMAMNYSILNTLSVYDVKTRTLAEIYSNSDAKVSGEEKFVAPLSVTGHSANILNGVMYVFFGYNPKYGFLNFAQKFNIANNSWSMVEGRGSSVEGTIGHTSTYDPESGLVYIFGGHATYQSSRLYSFDPRNELWTYLKPSPSPRFYHDAVLMNGQLLILGHSNYESSHKSDQCFQQSHLVFDLSCSQQQQHQVADGNRSLANSNDSCGRKCWTSIEDHSSNLLKRHGNSLAIYNNSKELLLFGGSNGMFMNDLWSMTFPSCSDFNSKDECERPKLALDCDWNILDSSCELRDRTFSPQSSNTDLDCSKIDITQLQIQCSIRETCTDCLSTSLNCLWCGLGLCQYKECRPFDHVTSDYDSCRRDNLIMEPVINVTSSELAPNRTQPHTSLPGELDNEIDCKVFNCYLCQTKPHCSWQNDACTYNPSFVSASSTSLASPSVVTPREELVLDHSNTTAMISALSGGGSTVSLSRMMQQFDSFIKSPLSSVAMHTMSPIQCDKPCFMRRSCNECTSSRCIWLSSTDQCVESSAYFAYGGPLVGAYVAHPTKCHLASCSEIDTCEGCLSNPRCGWMNDYSQTGLGRCMDGNSAGPLANLTSLSLASLNMTTPTRFSSNINGLAQASWFYTSCPSCQCNGHSGCYANSSSCASCQDHTEGQHCDKCRLGYYGNPVNGGKCKPCSCQGKAATCNRDNGRCFCSVKGTTGHSCERCDERNSYVPSSPDNGTCFYNLTTDYQYTFNMSKPEDHFYSMINFINVPIRKDSDVDFFIACNRLALVDIEFGVSHSSKKQLHTGVECGSFRLRFSHDLVKANHSFFVHVHEFQTPFTLQIAFSQGHRIFLPQFFFTFSSCFLFFFALSGVAYKLRHEFVLYQNNRRRFIEMEQMASRPLSTVLLESIKKTGTPGQLVEPSPIAFEPLVENNVGIMSVFVQLPGRPNLAIASALVSLNNATNSHDDTDGSLRDPEEEDDRPQGKRTPTNKDS